MGHAQKVCYRDRRTQQIVSEIVAAETALRWLYAHPLGVKLFDYVLDHAAFSWLYGKLQVLPWSRRKIAPFVARHGINLEEIEYPLEHYRNFHAFFTRRLKPQARPFPSCSATLGAPGEGKMLVYPQLTAAAALPVKGCQLSLATLLASEELAQRYAGGSALVVRLAPYDYHRFHFPDAGAASTTRTIRGHYHSVNPLALHHVPDVFCRNKRSISMLQSANFGCIAYIEVGALMVGSMVQTYTPGAVRRGQEKGFFQFGGSTLILLFEPRTIQFDDDLIRDSQNACEVHVLAGSPIGRRP